MTKQLTISEFLTYVSIPIVGFAIVNPMGPSFMGFSIGRTSDGRSNLMFFSLNPFSQLIEEINKYNFDSKTIDVDYMFSNFTISKDIGNFLLSRKQSKQEFGTPTLLFGMLDLKSEDALDKETSILSDIVNYSSDPLGTLEILKKFPMNVMDRVSHEMDNINKSISPQKLMTKESFNELFSIICNPIHIKQEFKGFNIAWAGAIDYQKKSGNSNLVKNALSLEEGLKIIGNLFPSLFALMMKN